MSTRGQMRSHVRTNLADAGVTFFTDDDINQAIQDAYNEVCARALCLVNSVTLNWPANTVYYDFKTDFAVTDYLGVYAILNNTSKWYLRDDVSLRDLDRIRRDWELWTGQPQFWCPHSLKYAVIAPHLTTASGTFKLWYYATAPTLASDTDSPLVSADFHNDIEHWATADLLESAEEVSKAAYWWSIFDPDFQEYKARCHNMAASDVLLRV